jgi:hypothetical protein
MWFSDASGSTPAALTPPQPAAAIAVLLTILFLSRDLRLSGRSMQMASYLAASTNYQRPEQGVGGDGKQLASRVSALCLFSSWTLLFTYYYHLRRRWPTMGCAFVLYVRSYAATATYDTSSACRAE